MNEPQTRLDLIDPAIRAAAWTAANGCRMLVEQSACEFAPGRVGKVRGEDTKRFYTFVLDNYVQVGFDVFTRDDALSQLIVTKYHTIDDARSTLGNLAAIRTGFATLQKEVYAA